MPYDPVSFHQGGVTYHPFGSPRYTHAFNCLFRTPHTRWHVYWWTGPVTGDLLRPEGLVHPPIPVVVGARQPVRTLGEQYAAPDRYITLAVYPFDFAKTPAPYIKYPAGAGLWTLHHGVLGHLYPDYGVAASAFIGQRQAQILVFQAELLRFIHEFAPHSLMYDELKETLHLTLAHQHAPV